MKKSKDRFRGANGCLPGASAQPATYSQSSLLDNGKDEEALDTIKLASEVRAELKRRGISQTVFAEDILGRKQGTVSDLLCNPKPWMRLKSGREIYRRMNQWLQSLSLSCSASHFTSSASSSLSATFSGTAALCPSQSTENYVAVNKNAADDQALLNGDASLSTSPTLPLPLSSGIALSSPLSSSPPSSDQTSSGLPSTASRVASSSSPAVSVDYSDRVQLSHSQAVDRLMTKLFNVPSKINSNNPADDSWQFRWTRSVRLSRKQYDLPSGSISREFVAILSDEVDSLTNKQTTSERVITFSAVVLQRDNQVKKASDIRKLIKRRLQMWNDGHFDALLSEAERCDIYFQQPAKRAQKKVPSDHEMKVFTRLMLQGKVKDAMKWISEKGKGGVLEPSHVFDINGEEKTVFEILKEKHPEPQPLSTDRLLQMEADKLPLLVDVDITATHVELAARRLRGSSGPGGTNADQWKDYLLRHGKSSERLRVSVAALASRLSNTIVEWKEINALMANRLIALDKCPGVRPIGVGECLRRILGKCLALATGTDVEDVCGTKQLCTGMKSGIEGSIHVMSDLFQRNSSDGWGLLLVDAANAFNSVNRIEALYQARVRWPRCSRYLYNTYCGSSALIIQGEDRILYSKEGVTQGDPLSMLLYGIALLPLIEKLNGAGNVIQNWYADDASANGTLHDIKLWFERLMKDGPALGYFPEPHKSYLVVSPEYQEKATELFGPLGVKVVLGCRFLGGFIGEETAKKQYLNNKMMTWIELVNKLSIIAASQPQAAFAALLKSLQCEWTYFQRVLPNCEEAFLQLEEALRNTFLPAMFGGPISHEERALFSLPANKGGIGIRDPTTTADLLYNTSRNCTTAIQESIQHKGAYKRSDHHRKLQEGKAVMRQKQQERDKLTFDETVSKFNENRKRTIERIPKGKCSSWLTVLPISRNHFDLSSYQFRDALSIRYGRSIIGAPTHCDGCGDHFSLTHALDCKKGGLVTVRHNEIRDALGDMANLVWKDVKREPIVREASEATPCLIADLGVRGVWQPQEEALFDVRVVDTDAPSYAARSVTSILASGEAAKKTKYHNACALRRAAFTPLVMSVDGILAQEATVFLKRLADRLSAKWEKSYGETMGWARTRLSFAIIRATNVCIRGCRTKWRSLGIDDSVSLSLASQAKFQSL